MVKGLPMPNPEGHGTTTTGQSITAETFARVRAVFEEALERAESERQAFVEAACAGDQVVLREVTKMLTADARAGAFIDRPRSEERRVGKECRYRWAAYH